MKCKVSALTAGYNLVAPVRERGLKYHATMRTEELRSRSRKGAWIEIANYNLGEGVTAVAPVRERGLKYILYDSSNTLGVVAPVRERGLK